MSSEIQGPRVPAVRPGPAGGRRDTNRRQKTEGLQEAALALFLERGIEATTIDDITKKAGVAKGSFYRYFADRTELVESLLKPIEAALVGSMEKAGLALMQAQDNTQLNETYAVLAMELGGVLLSNPDVVRLYLQECRAPLEGARAPVRRLADLVARHAVDLTEKARARGLLREFPPSISALAVVGAVERLLFSVLSGEEQNDPLTVSQNLISLVLDGVRAR